jgi:hypothetical protein
MRDVWGDHGVFVSKKMPRPSGGNRNDPTSQSWSKRLESYLQERKESLNWLGSGIMRLLAVVRFFWAS